MASTVSGMRLPPQNIESERALLGSVMLKPEVLYETTDIVRPVSFYVEKHRLIFEAMLELFSKNEPIDLLSLSSRIEEKGLVDRIGGRSYLSELVGTVPSASNVGHYAALVQKKFMMRQLIDATDSISKTAYDAPLL
jgi:replicative DNA helicase